MVTSAMGWKPARLTAANVSLGRALHAVMAIHAMEKRTVILQPVAVNKGLRWNAMITMSAPTMFALKTSVVSSHRPLPHAMTTTPVPLTSATRKMGASPKTFPMPFATMAMRVHLMMFVMMDNAFQGLPLIVSTMPTPVR